MSPRELALVTDSRNPMGDEAGNTPDSDLVPQLKIAIEFANLTRRVSELERDNRENRQTINRILTRFATMGWSLPEAAS